MLTINRGRKAEEGLKAVPGAYATTQVRRASDRVTAPNVFTNPDWSPSLGTERRHRNDLRPQVSGEDRGRARSLGLDLTPLSLQQLVVRGSGQLAGADS